MSKVKNIVLLLAGGCGQRMHSDCPKQFMKIDGVPVILHTMRAFQEHTAIDDIYVVCAPEWKDFVVACTLSGKITKFAGTFSAGETSFNSLQNGIKGLNAIFKNDENPTVIVHEAVRPLIDSNIISRNLHTFQTYGNAITATRSNEAYMESSNGISSNRSLPRETLYKAQTPQTFSLDELNNMFRAADEKNIKTSQSLFTLVREVCPERELYISPGSELNFNITHPEDIETLKAIISYQHHKE